MQKRVGLLAMPTAGFTLKDVTYPKTPEMKKPFTVKGKVNLLGLSFLGPVWVIVSVTYPEKWWEAIRPIIGGPEAREMTMATGGEFEATFAGGFDRDGEYTLAVRLYAGPTLPIDSIVLPPFPPVATVQSTFTIAPLEVTLGKPTVSPSTIMEGTQVIITVPVTSKMTSTKKVIVKCAVTYGSVLPGPGSTIREYTSPAQTMAPNAIGNFQFAHTEVAPNDGRRDLLITVLADSTVVVDGEHFDDVWKVTKEITEFEIGQPIVSPAIRVPPKTPITLTIPIMSRSNKEQTVKVAVKMYEGSFLPTHGDLIETLPPVSLSILPGATKNATFQTIAKGGEDRKDVGVEVYVSERLVASDEFDDVFWITKAAIGFDLGEPYSEPRPVAVGTEVLIHCPVISRCTSQQSIVVKANIYNEEIPPSSGTGTLLTTISSPSITILPGESKDVQFKYTVTNTGRGYRNVGVEVWVGASKITDDVFHDCIEVTTAVIGFDLGQPVATPSTVAPGQVVTIICPVTSTSTVQQTATAMVKIYEGSALPTSGTLLDTKTVQFTIAPGQTYNVTVQHTAVAGTIDRRDVGVEIYVGGKLITSDESDDIFYVSAVAIGFDLGEPYSEPRPVAVGTEVLIHCPVISRCTSQQSIVVKANIYDEEIPPSSGTGTLLSTISSPSITILPGESKDVQFKYTVTNTGRGYRNVGVEVWVGGSKIKDDVFHDVIQVSPVGPPAALSILNSPIYSGEALKYSFSGFQPYAVVSLYVQDGGGFTNVADADGAGAGAFWDNDPPGTYTLVAEDTYGHGAQAAFAIIAIPTAVSFKVYAAETPFTVTTKWMLYWEPEGQAWVSDQKWHGIEDPIQFFNVPAKGRLAAFCMGGWPGYDISPEYDSVPFVAKDGASVVFHIVTGAIDIT